MKNFNFIILIFFIFLQKSILGENNFHVDFDKINEAHQIWLGDAFNPEPAVLSGRIPHKYHIKNQENTSSIDDWLDEQNNSSTTPGYNKCSDDIVHLLSNRQYLYQMLDATGKIDSGILRGNLIWPGYFDECLNVYVPMDEKGHGDFHGQYCKATWSLNVSNDSPVYTLTTGLCLPDSCSGEKMTIAIKKLMHYISDYVIPKEYKSILTLKDTQCTFSHQSMKHDSASIVYLTFVSIILLLVLIGSSITVWHYWRSQSGVITDHGANRYAFPRYGAIGEPESSSTQADQKKLPKNESSIIVTSETYTPPPKTTGVLLKEFFLCFSAFTNGAKILNSEQAEGQLLSIHGIRVLSLTWVILGHTYITCVSIIGNKLDAVHDIDNFAFQLMLQCPFSVDSFFVLSGFLLGYLFLKEMTRREGQMQWLYFYLHRIWRLTPAYLIVVFFYMLVFKYLGSGPFWDYQHCDADRGSWWWYLLYINNFIPVHDMCIGWSWYLANDMQFYLISPLFLYPLWRWPKIGFGILFSLLTGSWITTAVLSYTNNIMPMFVGVTRTQDFETYMKLMWEAFNIIYDKPYCRIPPYLIGIILAYIFLKTNGRKGFLPLWQQIVGWLCGAFFSLTVLYGLYNVEMSRTTALFYNSLCRSSFSLGLVWVIFACETGHGGFVTKILSMKFWIPLSRLTYSAYLVHPIIIHAYFMSYRTSLYFTHFFTVTNFFGFLIMAYALAFCFSLAFESPFMNLEKLLLKRRR